VTPARGPDAVAAEVLDRGYALLPGVIEPGLLDRLTDRIDVLMDELGVAYGDNAFLGHRTRRIFNLLGRDAGFADVVLHDAVLPVVERVLDAECLLSSLTAIEMQPGETDQPLHADDGSMGLARPHPPLSCTAIWALTDFTEANGATRVVPGSHLIDRIPRRGDDPPSELAVMERGSVLVYHGSTWHGGRANTAGDRRLGIVANYCAGYVRQEENQLLAVPRELAASLPRRLQQMLGYGVYRGLMGHVDRQDPGVLLDPDVETDMVWSRMR
jgi:ectoine hydroxylase-related dioxygenase (phytanoyl-CoA dioxygenase family)